MFIQEFQCKSCGKVQEKWLKERTSPNEEPCEECEAEAESLEPILSPSHKHGTWGRWTV